MRRLFEVKEVREVIASLEVKDNSFGRGNIGGKTIVDNFGNSDNFDNSKTFVFNFSNFFNFFNS